MAKRSLAVVKTISAEEPTLRATSRALGSGRRTSRKSRSGLNSEVICTA
jgi:hypothetical protein